MLTASHENKTPGKFSVSVEPDIHKLLERAKAELDRQAMAATGHPVQHLHLLDIKKRDFSLVLILSAETSASRRKLVLKKVVHHPVNLSVTQQQNQAVVEFDILSRLYPQFQDFIGCAVPRPVAIFPEEEAFIMEFVEGRPLSEQFDHARYWGLPSRFRELERSYFLLGQWLEHFHSVTGVEYSGPEIFTSLLERCELRLLTIEQHPAFDGRTDLRSKVLKFLKEQIATMPQDSVPIAGRHGDLGGWNVLVNSNGVIVFDFLGYEKDPVVYDILKVVLTLQAWEFHPLYSVARIRSLQGMFLKGLGAVPLVSCSVAAICEAYHRVCIANACLINPGKRWDDRVWKRRMYKHNCEVLQHPDAIIEKYRSSELCLATT